MISVVLPQPFGPDDTDSIAAHDARGKIRDDGRCAVVERRVPRFEDQPARGRRLLDLEFDLPDALATLAALPAQLLEGANPAFVARAPRLDTLADPRFLLRQLLVEQRRMLGLDFERGELLQHVIIVVAAPLPQLSAIQFDDASREAADERAVVTDEQQRTVEIDHHVLEPGDRFDIEVVRGLIQQQQVGRRHERPSEHHAPAPPARQCAQRRIAIELQARDDLIYLQVGLPLTLRSTLADALLAPR